MRVHRNPNFRRGIDLCLLAALVGLGTGISLPAGHDIARVVLAVLAGLLYLARLLVMLGEQKHESGILEEISLDAVALAVFLVQAGDIKIDVFGQQIEFSLEFPPLVYGLVLLGLSHLVRCGREVEASWDTTRALAAGYLAVCALSALLSIRPPASRHEFVYLVCSLSLFLVAGGQRLFLQRPGRILGAFLAGYLVLAFHALVQVSVDSPRLLGTLPHANHLAGLLVLTAPVLVGVALRGRVWILRAFGGLLVLSAVFFIAQTGSRAGQAGFLIGLACFCFLGVKRRWMIAVLAGFVLVQLAFWQAGTNRWLLLASGIRGHVLEDRLNIWRWCLSAPREPYRYLLGFGPGHTLKRAFLRTEIPSTGPGLAEESHAHSIEPEGPPLLLLDSGRLEEVSHAHSIFLQQFVGAGLLGLLFFLGLLAGIFRGVLPFRRGDPYDIVRIALGAGVIGLLSHGIADFLLEKQLGFAFWLALGLLVSSGRRPPAASPVRSS